MKKINKINGFTLIELVITVTIMIILLGATYINYSYYQNKLSLKTTGKDIIQSLYSSRNMAINGLDYNSGNLSVGIYFDNSNINKNKLSILSYPHDFNFSSLDPINDLKVKNIKDITFQKRVQIDSISGYNKFLFVFDSITGSGSYYFWNSNTKTLFTGSEIDIKISYAGSTSSLLSKDIKYITSTNIVDSQ